MDTDQENLLLRALLKNDHEEVLKCVDGIIRKVEEKNSDALFAELQQVRTFINGEGGVKRALEYIRSFIGDEPSHK